MGLVGRKGGVSSTTDFKYRLRVVNESDGEFLSLSLSSLFERRLLHTPAWDVVLLLYVIII